MRDDVKQIVGFFAYPPKVVFQKWRATEIAVTLGLMAIASQRGVYSAPARVVRIAYTLSRDTTQRGAVLWYALTHHTQQSTTTHRRPHACQDPEAAGRHHQSLWL